MARSTVHGVNAHARLSIPCGMQLADPVPAAVRVIVSPGPSDTQSVVEGQPFPVQPAVRVLDESGYPVVNVTVFAFLMVEDGA